MANGLDDDAPRFESGGLSGFKTDPATGATILEFATPLPAADGSASAQSTSLRINVRIVMTPLAVAQMAKFLHHMFPLDDPIPEPAPKH